MFDNADEWADTVNAEVLYYMYKLNGVVFLSIKRNKSPLYYTNEVPFQMIFPIQINWNSPFPM